ncbi:hypothetical protein [Luethyella okanaganae]|uniref:DUF3137 domain-containing protein n=1 Tax=Luethyella okanaganae TaxID=69372 RepID=A0ABW1VES4_9MICO
MPNEWESTRTGADQAGSIDSEWPLVADAEVLDAMLHDFEREVGTVRGFRRRARKSREWLAFGFVIGAPILFFGLPVWASTATATGTIGGDGEAIWWVAVGVLFVTASIVALPLKLRREFRTFQEQGWVAFQAPTGWVVCQTDSGSYVRYDTMSVSGGTDFRGAISAPVVLVSPRRMPAARFAQILNGVRTSIAQTDPEDGKVLMRSFDRERVLRAVPARWFGDTAGCLLGGADREPFTIVIPRAVKAGRHIRLASIRLTSEERRLLAGGQVAARRRSWPEQRGSDRRS